MSDKFWLQSVVRIFWSCDSFLIFDLLMTFKLKIWTRSLDEIMNTLINWIRVHGVPAETARQKYLKFLLTEIHVFVFAKVRIFWQPKNMLNILNFLQDDLWILIDLSDNINLLLVTLFQCCKHANTCNSKHNFLPHECHGTLEV